MSFVLWMSALAALVSVQDTQPPPAVAELQVEDVLVKARRDRGKPPVEVRLLGSANALAESAISIRANFSHAQRMAGCAVRGRLSKPATLRAVVEGDYTSFAQRVAQDYLVRQTISCGASTDRGRMSNSPDLGASLYDRGAFVMAALRSFAPGYVLTRAQTHDRTVQRRFDVREVPRIRFMSTPDRDLFRLGVCLVRLQPALSADLAYRDAPPADTGRLISAIINGSPECTGRPRRLVVDPTQIRIYVADAYYRWVMAAKGVDTLIPDS